MNWRLERQQRQTERRRERIVELARERGIAIERRGLGWHLYGRGVDLATTDLAMLSDNDLQPVETVVS